MLITQCSYDVLVLNAGVSVVIMQAGLDSIGSVELNRAIAEHYDLTLPPTLVFDYPTLDSIAAFIATKLHTNNPYIDSNSKNDGWGLVPLAAPGFIAQPQTQEQALVGIAGVSCQFPGSINTDLFSFWTTVSTGSSLQKPIPLRKWDMDALFDPESTAASRSGTSMYCRFAATLERGVESFDAEVFRLTPSEASLMDPHARLLLEHVYSAVVGSAVQMSAEIKSATGVYVGCMWPSGKSQDFIQNRTIGVTTIHENKQH